MLRSRKRARDEASESVAPKKSRGITQSPHLLHSGTDVLCSNPIEELKDGNPEGIRCGASTEIQLFVASALPPAPPLPPVASM